MVQTPLTPQTLYPDSDGKPMADNTEQYKWIVMLVENLKRLLQDQTAFVAGDLLWYPIKVESVPGQEPQKAPCQAADAMVVLGRPDKYRGSYQQWKENNIAPQVVFEILSPSNSHLEMAEKQRFYQKYGVLEMYFYDPKAKTFWGFTRSEDKWNFVTELNLPWISPLLKIRFEMFEDGLEVFYPNGEPFKTLSAFAQERDQAQLERNQAQEERDRLAAKLRELGVDPDQL
ncbi:MAG: Uma2 family endonuclease [Symploca sp. SIO3E6]|nr:Uma2 family endonuclease [Caldora sp. SIO3E6]